MQLKSGDVVLGSGTLVDGKVTIPTGAFDSEGTKTLTATYAGDATTKPSAGSVEITVVPGSADPGGHPPALTIRGKADANRERTKAAIRVRCRRGPDPCEGAVHLRVGEQTIGWGSFTVAAGTRDAIHVELNSEARELLAERKRVMTTLAITYADGRTERVRLRLTR